MIRDMDNDFHVLQGDGTLNPLTNDRAKATDRYILKGGGPHRLESGPCHDSVGLLHVLWR